MDIECARTGRHFNNVESTRECSYQHDRCNACPYDKLGSNDVPHFITNKTVGIPTQQEISKLMVDIYYHLAKEKRQQKYIIKTSNTLTQKQNINLVIPYAKKVEDSGYQLKRIKNNSVQKHLDYSFVGLLLVVLVFLLLGLLFWGLR